LVALCEVTKYVVIRRGEALHLLTAVAPLQGHDDSTRRSVHDDPVPAGILPATQHVELGLGRTALCNASHPRVTRE